MTIETRAVTTRSVDHGLSLIRAHEPTTLIILGDSLIFDSTAIEVDPDPEATQVIETIPNPKPVKLLRTLRTLCRRAVAWVVQAVRTARRAAAWVATAGTGLAARAGDWWRRYRSDYAGHHRARVAWYGRERSTAEFVSQYRAATQREPSGSREGDLSDLLDLPRDIAFVGHIARCIEVMREEQLVIHQPGRHFICS